MSAEIKVYVIRMGGTPNYQLQWKCPHTGRKKTRSSGIANDGKARSHQAAVKAAAKLEADLKTNYSACTEQITFEKFRERYESEVATGLAVKTQERIATVLNAVEEIMRPVKLSHITEERISAFTATLRTEKKSEASIKSTLAHLKAALRWAARMKLITAAPSITMPGRVADRSKGRPITGEEFERMLEAVAKVVDAPDVAAWKRFLRGLWLSGLRIGEAVNLTWDRDDRIRVELGGRRPMLWIPASMEKANKNRMLPLTPDFAAFLMETPAEQRRGRVFPLPSQAAGGFLETDRIGKLTSRIGKEAGVVVVPATETKEAKFASAHDFRRSFGERWSAILMPQQLKELMRHEDISTTMRYYVGRNAERTADVVWAAFESQNSQAKELAKSAAEQPANKKTADTVSCVAAESSNVPRDGLEPSTL